MANFCFLLLFSILSICQELLGVPVIEPNEVDIDINVDPSAYGVPVTELDILVDPRQDQQKRSDADEKLGYGLKRKADTFETSRWTDNTLVYKIKENDFTTQEIQEIRKAIADFEKHTCIKFRKAQSTDKAYVHIMDGAGCASTIGMTGREQQLYLAKRCRHVGIIVHELGHALGFYHEHMRPDRDRYIKINTNNVKKDDQHNFVKQPSKYVDTYGIDYDYLSVMHYGAYAFSSNGQQTIELLQKKTFKDSMGQRYGLSFLDINLANQMYKCSAHCPYIKCHAYSFVSKDCTCQCADYKVISDEPFIFHTTAAQCDEYGSLI